jgi:hypothetical protein
MGAVKKSNAALCPCPPGRLTALSASHSKSFLYGAFVGVHRALNSPQRRFPARAVVSQSHRRRAAHDAKGPREKRDSELSPLELALRKVAEGTAAGGGSKRRGGAATKAKAPSPSATTADTLMAMGGGAGAGGRPGGNRAALKAFGQKHAT